MVEIVQHHRIACMGTIFRPGVSDPQPQLPPDFVCSLPEGDVPIDFILNDLHAYAELANAPWPHQCLNQDCELLGDSSRQSSVVDTVLERCMC